MLGQPLFPGESGIDQLVEIIKVLGTPSREQIKTMNPNYMEHKFPQIKPHPFSKVCRRVATSYRVAQPLRRNLVGLPASHGTRGDRFSSEAAGVHAGGAVERGRGHVSPILRRITARGCEDAQREGVPTSLRLYSRGYVLSLSLPQVYKQID